MRDPLEAHGPTLGAALWVPDDPAAAEALQRSYQEAWKQVSAAHNRTKLLSLTVDAEDYTGTAEIFGRGWARARMWEQYAEDHAGVCLLFKRDSLQRLVLDQLGRRSAGARGGLVRYSQTALVESPARTLLLNPTVGPVDLAAHHLRQHSHDLFFLKLADWASEHEYRFIEPSDEDNSDYSFVEFGPSLAAVIVGPKFPNWQIPALLEICKEAGADAKQLSWGELNGPIPLDVSVQQGPR